MASPEAVERRREKLAIKSILSVLTDREAEIFRLRFSADLTWHEVGRAMGESAEAVRKVVDRALDRVRDLKNVDLTLEL